MGLQSSRKGAIARTCGASSHGISMGRSENAIRRKPILL
jgi:hypothetical protein